MINIKYLVDNVESPYIFNELKYQKVGENAYENNRACALREFYEETNVEPKLFKLYKNIIPIMKNMLE